MMMEAAPPAPFIIPKAEFLFELLIITLDPPPQLCQSNQAVESNILGQVGEPILGWLRFAFWPLGQQPFFCTRLAQQVVAMSGPHPAPRKARSKPVGTALAPRNGLPRLLRQAEGEGLDRKRLVLSALQPRLRSSATRSRLRRHGSLTRRPYRGVGTDPRDVAHAESGDVRPQPRVVAIAGVHQHHAF